MERGGQDAIGAAGADEYDPEGRSSRIHGNGKLYAQTVPGSAPSAWAVQRGKDRREKGS